MAIPVGAVFGAIVRVAGFIVQVVVRGSVGRRQHTARQVVELIVVVQLAVGLVLIALFAVAARGAAGLCFVAIATRSASPAAAPAGSFARLAGRVGASSPAGASSAS